MKPFQRKYCSYFLFICCFLANTNVFSQNYHLVIQQVDKDNSLSQSDKLNRLQSLNLQTSFPNKEACTDYIFKLPGILTNKGYPAASIDSVFYEPNSTYINLYLGEQFKWVEVNTDSVDKKLLNETGWEEKLYHDKKMEDRVVCKGSWLISPKNDWL